MIDLTLSKASGVLDIVITDGVLMTSDGDDELRQRVEFGLEFFQNDWFLDLGFGIPYYGRVFQRGVNVDDLYGIFTYAIEREPGIAHVTELNIIADPAVRVLRVTGSALSERGVIVPLDSLSGGIA